MPTANDTIAYALANSQAMLKRFVEDLSSQEYLHRPAPKANCAAWLVGHLTLTDRKALVAFGGQPPDLPDGFEHRFSRKEGCPQAEEFGDVSVLVPLFDRHRARLIEAVKAAPPRKLDEPIENRPMFKTMGEMAAFIAVHTAMHAGQITIIRRSLGRPPVV